MIGAERGEADITRVFTQSRAIAPDYDIVFTCHDTIHDPSRVFIIELGVLFIYDV